MAIAVSGGSWLAELTFHQEMNDKLASTVRIQMYIQVVFNLKKSCKV